MDTKSVIDAHSVNKEKLVEQETIKAQIKADIAIVLPGDIGSSARIDLKYDAIAQAVNSCVECYTIDPRISEVDLDISAPNLPDGEATANLRDTLTGEKKEVVVNEEIVQVDNEAISDDKVVPKFELSIEETVILDENGEYKQYENERPQSGKSPSSNEKSVHESSSSGEKNNPVPQSGDLVIQSSEPKLYWQSTPQTQLYWENAPSNVSNNERKSLFSQETKDKIVEYGIEGTKIVGSGLRGPDSITGVAKKVGHVKVGDNGRIYTSPKANGNQYYKIAGKLADNKVINRMGAAGTLFSLGATVAEAKYDYSKTENSRERSEIVGGAVGKFSFGFIAGTAASAATTAVLVTIAGAAGVAAAPVTLVVIAGCAIVAGAAASGVAEEYGEKKGQEAGAAVLDFWESR